MLIYTYLAPERPEKPEKYLYTPERPNFLEVDTVAINTTCMSLFVSLFFPLYLSLCLFIFSSQNEEKFMPAFLTERLRYFYFSYLYVNLEILQRQWTEGQNAIWGIIVTFTYYFTIFSRLSGSSFTSCSALHKTTQSICQSKTTILLTGNHLSVEHDFND